MKDLILLLELDWKHSIRTYFSFREELVKKIVMILIFIYISVVFYFIGYNLGKFIKESNLLSFLMAYFFYEFIFRFFFQSLSIPIQVIYLPISKSLVSGFVSLKSALSAINLFSFFLFVPIFILTSSPFLWIIFTILCVIILNFLVILLRSIANLWTNLVLIALAILFSTTIITDNSYIGDFSMVLDNLEISKLIPYWSFMGLVLYLYTLKVIRSRLFIDSSINSYSASIFTNFLDRSELIISNELLILELKLILRNKRPLYYFAIIASQFFLLFAYSDLIASNYKLIYWMFLNSLLMIVYGQFLFAWESQFFQYLVIYADYNNYIKAKINLLNAICFVNLLLTLPIAIMKNEIFYFLTTGAFSLGVSSLLIIITMLNNRVRLNLDQNAFFNYQGVSALTWIVTPIIVAIPEIIIIPFQLIDDENLGLLIIGCVGLFFLISRNRTSSLITSRFRLARFRMYSGFKKDIK
jgi:hypothetical protein